MALVLTIDLNMRIIKPHIFPVAIRNDNLRGRC